MFGLFKKRQREAHPLHRMFARMFIPTNLEPGDRGAFLGAMLSPKPNDVLQRCWHDLGAKALTKALTPKDLLPPDGLSGSAFRHDKFLCFFIIFPEPKAPGESYFGFVVAGPSDDWSPEARANVPVRYFILERSSSDVPTVFEWRQQTPGDSGDFESLGAGPSPQHPPHFSNSILSRFFGYVPNA